MDAATHESRESRHLGLEGTPGNEAGKRSEAGSSGNAEQRLRACVASIGLRDQAALAELYDATAGRVYGLAMRMLRNIQAAEEIVSDVYFHVWQSAAAYDHARGTVETWLLVMCRSRALDALRSRSRRQTEELPETAEGCDESGDPLDILAAARRGSRIQACLYDLTPVQRQMIALAFFRGYSHSEIAARTARPLGSVKTHLRKALEKLRVVLGDDSGE